MAFCPSRKVLIWGTYLEFHRVLCRRRRAPDLPRPFRRFTWRHGLSLGHICPDGEATEILAFSYQRSMRLSPKLSLQHMDRALRLPPVSGPRTSLQSPSSTTEAVAVVAQTSHWWYLRRVRRQVRRRVRRRQRVEGLLEPERAGSQRPPNLQGRNRSSAIVRGHEGLAQVCNGSAEGGATVSREKEDRSSDGDGVLVSPGGPPRI